MASASTNPANQPRAKRTRRLKASGTRIDGLELRMPALVDEDLLLSQVAILPGKITTGMSRCRNILSSLCNLYSRMLMKFCSIAITHELTLRIA